MSLSASFPVDTKIVTGLPHIEINQIAQQEDCSIIVIGSQGHSMVGEIFLGGVESGIVHDA